jgi:hypothetical protein
MAVVTMRYIDFSWMALIDSNGHKTERERRIWWLLLATDPTHVSKLTEIVSVGLTVTGFARSRVYSIQPSQ